MARKSEKLTAEFRKYVETWRKYFKENIQQYHDFHEFVLGSQWEDDEEQILKNYNKIPLQFNQLAPLLNHIVGEQRMNTPNLQVTPDQNTVSEDTLKVREALIKKISLDSKARVVYQTAFQQAAVGGFGAYRINKEYINRKSFDQIPMIQGIRDATRCFWDVGAESPCKTDGMHSGLYTRMSRKLFRKKYGKDIEESIPPTVTETENDTSASFQWQDDDSITIGECYKRKLINSTLYELSNRETVEDDEFNKLEDLNLPEADEDGEMQDRIYKLHNGIPVTVTRKRKVTSYTIKHYKWAGDYILEETEFESQQQPVVFVDQNSYFDKQGRQICRPLFKDARDAQRFINYLGTQIAYLIKISRYDQFIASRANLKSPKTQMIWKNPSVVQGALIYDVDKEGGTKPEQLRPPELAMTLLTQYQRACDDIQRTTGIYDTRMGNQGNEISGAAIDARTKQGSYNTYIVFDALNRAIAVGGEIIDEMIPHLFDTERTMSLEMENGAEDITLNQQADEYGTTTLNDMTQGDFKVRLLPGPSYEGQKAEALQAMGMLLQANPQIFSIIADLYAANLPVPNVIELVNRLRTLVPPEILDAGKTGQPIQPKQPQQDPMIMLKIQELMLKDKAIQQAAQSDAMDAKIKIAELENERLDMARELQESIMRFNSENNRAMTDKQIAHAQNIVELLTRPNKFNTHEPKTSKQT